MLDPQRQEAIDSAVLGAYRVFRGSADPSDCIGYALAMLLLKYLSDIGQGSGNPRFVVPEGADFQALYAVASEAGNGRRIDQALGSLEEANANLRGVFQDISFDATALGSPEQKDRLLRELLGVFGTASALNFRESLEDAAQAVAHASDSLLKYGATNSGKRGGEFFTPPEVSRLMAHLIQPDAGETIGDPCCGSGSLLIACSQLAREKSGHSGCPLYGQEKNGSTWALAKMNLILHGETEFQLEWGDTLRAPTLLAADDKLRRFDIVVSIPPFSLKEWGHEEAERDIYQRYRRGVPPRATGDYAFLSHMVETLHPTAGRMATVVSLGVLFRGAAEHQIRKHFIQENLIDTVIALPAKIFPHTTIPTAVLVLRKDKTDDRVLFINAADSFQYGKHQNRLQQADLDRITHIYRSRSEAVGYARVVSRDEIAARDYNLNVAQYVQPIEDEPEVDLEALQTERAQLKAELTALEGKLANLLKGIGYA